MGFYSWIKGKLGGGGKVPVSGVSPRLLNLDVSSELSGGSLMTNAVYQAASVRFANILSKIDLSVTAKGKEVFDRPDIDRVFNYRPNDLDPDAVNFRKQFFGSLFNNFIALAYLEWDYSSIPAKLKGLWYIDPTTEQYRVGYDTSKKKVVVQFKWGEETKVVYEEDVIAIPFFPATDSPFGNSRQKAALQDVLNLISQNFYGLSKTIASANAIRFLAQSPQPLAESVIKQRQEKLTKQLFSVDNMGILYLDGAQSMTQVNNSSPWTGTDEVAKQESHIYEYLGIPKAVVEGTATDDVYQSFVEMSVEPITMQLSRQLTNKLLSIGEYNHGRRIEFDTADLFTASQAHRQKAASVLITSGRYYPNEIRKVMGMPLLSEKENTLIDRIDRIDSSSKEETNEDGNEQEENQ